MEDKNTESGQPTSPAFSDIQLYLSEEDENGGADSIKNSVANLEPGSHSIPKQESSLPEIQDIDSGKSSPEAENDALKASPANPISLEGKEILDLGSASVAKDDIEISNREETTSPDSGIVSPGRVEGSIENKEVTSLGNFKMTHRAPTCNIVAFLL